MSIETVRPHGHAVRAALGERVVVARDPAWDEARQPWNLIADQRASGIRIAAQGSGHGAVPLGPLEDSILLRTGQLNHVSIDSDRRRARVGAGVRWRDVTFPAAKHGLAALAGSSPDVGVAGYTLGGGIGWLARRFGTAANAVRAIELVVAGGKAIRVDASNEPDLFWALRGGGGNFGVVTAIEFDLFPVPSIYAGNLFWPIERSDEIVRAWRAHLEAVPRTVTTEVRLFQFPPIPDLPEVIRGQSFVVIGAACLLEPAAADEILRPWRELGPGMDTFAEISPADLPKVSMDPEDPVPVVGDGMLVRELSSAAIDAVLAAAGPGTGSPLLMLELRQLGGALAESSPDHGALDTLQGDAVLFALGIGVDPAASAAIDDRISRVQAALRQWDGGRYSNFAERPMTTDAFFPSSTQERLRAIKARYDPRGMFRGNHPVDTAPL